ARGRALPRPWAGLAEPPPGCRRASPEPPAEGARRRAEPAGVRGGLAGLVPPYGAGRLGADPGRGVPPYTERLEDGAARGLGAEVPGEFRPAKTVYGRHLLRAARRSVRRVVPSGPEFG